MNNYKIIEIQLFFLILTSLFIGGCSFKTTIKSKSATIIFKTPKMKFYDKGFITKYDDYINLQIFNIGKLVLELNIYKNQICQNSFKCTNSKEFNSKYFNKLYQDDFLYNLFSKNKIYFKDKENHILIKVK
jgi:hypothetical protein